MAFKFYRECLCYSNKELLLLDTREVDISSILYGMSSRNINKNYTHASFGTVFKRYLAEIISRSTYHIYLSPAAMFPKQGLFPTIVHYTCPVSEKNDRSVTTYDLLNRTATSRWYSQKTK